MTNSMKDLLLGLGFQPVAKEAPAPKQQDQPRHQHQRHRQEQQQQRSRPDPSRQQPRRSMPDGRRPGPPSPASRPQEHAKLAAPAAGPQHKPQRTREEIDLARAYAMRAQKEKDERIEAERLKQEAARIKREAKAKVAELLKDKSLNDANAELTRHFDYNGKIRRVHVTDTQLKSLNAGELAVVQMDGRYLLVAASLAGEVQTLLPSLVALMVDPNAPVSDDPYADPKYAVPDDLVW
jgi:uncharacterized protein